MQNKSPALTALLNYQQADMDGTMVLVSRQAIHEVAAEIEELQKKPAITTDMANVSVSETEDREEYNLRVHGLREEDLP